jgi:hypothetical protein
MALPSWLTRAGSLGIIPELKYYELTLDAYDPSIGQPDVPISTLDAGHSAWTFVNGTINLIATGLPYHSYGNPDAKTLPAVQNYNQTWPNLGGTDYQGTGDAVNPGIIGYWINGVAVFAAKAPSTSKPSGYDVAPSGFNYNASYASGQQLGYNFGEDLAGGHASRMGTTRTGIYHYHDFSFARAWLTGQGATDNSLGIPEASVIAYLNGSLTHPDGHSKIVGWSLDGFPIYGPYGYNTPVDITSGVKIMRSSYQLQDPSYRPDELKDFATYPMGIFAQDYVYTGMGDLDQCNGRYCATPDYPNGTYAYFVTVDAEGVPVYPYVLGANYYGTPIPSAQNNTTDGGGRPPRNVNSNDVRTNVLKYSLVSGRLPLGIQLIPTGRLQGVPISQLTGPKDVTSTFTIRAQNTQTGGLADRTFSLTITNVAPPVIYPKNVNLGVYYDGTIIDYNFQAVEYTPGADLQWSVVGGELPPGLTLESNGRIHGYLQPILSADSLNQPPNWDETPWGDYPWQFDHQAIRKAFQFTIQVFDGVNYDQSSYRLEVFPISYIPASNEDIEITIDRTNLTYNPLFSDTNSANLLLGFGPTITVDSGVKHTPIILTEQSDFVEVRQGSYYAFHIQAIDLDYDALLYTSSINNINAFDNQVFAGNVSLPYVPAVPSAGMLYSGVWPKANHTFIEGRDEYSLDYTQVNYPPGSGFKVLDTVGRWHNAVANTDTIVRISGNTRVTCNPSTTVFLAQLPGGANAAVTAITATTGVMAFSNIITANVGDYITTTSGNAQALTSVVDSLSVPVTHLSGNILVGGWASINGSNTQANVTYVTYNTDITCTYFNASTFITQVPSEGITINGTVINGTISKIVAVGVDVDTNYSIESDVGFDESNKFDGQSFGLPGSISIDPYSGWILGYIPAQTINRVDYSFDITAAKQIDAQAYNRTKSFKLTVLGDLYNTINWITPTDLGTIENGKVSSLSVQAVNTRGRSLFYNLFGKFRLPQGLKLTPNGLIIGRISFEMFNLDLGTTTIDGGNTGFSIDSVYTFTIAASDIDQTVGATQTFTLRVVRANNVPYENLYLKALPTTEQRTQFLNLIQNRKVFPLDLIYRNEDPFFGLARDIKTLFLPGLAPRSLSDYADAVMTNHYNKRILFGDVKSAVVLDDFFKPKYEVVYVEILDENTNSLGQSPADLISAAIKNPYLAYTYANNTDEDEPISSFNNIYPNSFGNMKNVMVSLIDVFVALDSIDQHVITVVGRPDIYVNMYVTGSGVASTAITNVVYNPYTDTTDIVVLATVNLLAGTKLIVTYYANKGALPEWMTSNQPTDTGGFVAPLGFTRAVVLAYAVPGGSALMVNRLKQLNFDFNSIDFTVDRYQLDNSYSDNFNIDLGRFLTSSETTFDRYLPFDSYFTTVGVVNYAVSIPFDQVNGRTIDVILSEGGLDGIKDFRAGDTIVFAQQEFSEVTYPDDVYNNGWYDNLIVWSGDPWAYDSNTGDDATDPDPTAEKWDNATIVPGFLEHASDPTVANQRIGVWKIRIVDNEVVFLDYVSSISINYYSVLRVKRGLTYGGRNIYYDPVLKFDNKYPNYSILPQEQAFSYTSFDGNGTRFLNYRDNYSIPETGDKYIKFAKTGVFN